MIIVGKENFERTCTVKNNKLGMISTAFVHVTVTVAVNYRTVC